MPSVIETDYLVVGAGASSMAFVDAVLSGSDARVVVVDRRHRPGGHWLDAYPFVRLHQPSANYGVTSRRLGEDRIDSSGINAGFYERATADEICDYFLRVIEGFEASGRVRFLPMTHYRGEDVDGHHVTSLLSGADTLVRSHKLVDATYIQSEIPSRRLPSYAVDPGVRVIPPNALVHLADVSAGFTLVGAGKTAMDTCVWLLDNGVDPERIRWIRPRDPWLFNRGSFQPLELVGCYMQMQADWVEAAAAAIDGNDFCHRLEAAGVVRRIDESVEPEVWRGAIISDPEIEALRLVERVVRHRRVLGIGETTIAFDTGEVATTPGEVYVDCTAPGVSSNATREVFDGDRIVLQYVTIGVVPWGAATIGMVEVTREDEAEKNRLCPTLTFTGRAADIVDAAHAGMTGIMARGLEPDLAAWTEACRLNPAAGAMGRAAEPEIASALARMGQHFGEALHNLARLTSGGMPTVISE